MFEAVFRLYFKDTDENGNPLMEDINYQIINGVISPEDEMVELKMVTVRSEIEDSMLQLEDHLDEQIKKAMKDARNDFDGADRK